MIDLESRSRTIWALSLTVLAACQGVPAAVEIVRLDGAPSYYGDFEAYVLDAVGEEASTLDEAALAALFSNFVDELCLAHLAIERGLAPTSAPRGEAVARLLATIESPLADDRQVRLYYERHLDDFLRPESVVLGQILTQERSAAEELLRRIGEGTSFAESVPSLGGEADVIFAGYQEGVTADDLPEELADRIFGLQPGEVSEVVETESGFHLFHLLDRQPAQRLSLERARRSIEQSLRQEATDAALESMVREARVRYNIELLPENLPFRLTP